MTRGQFTGSILMASAILLSTSAVASDCSDVEGSDHPQIPRYQESCLIAHVERGYDSFFLPTGPAVRENNSWTAAQSESMEGKTTRLMYLVPHGRSVLEVFRNYEGALAQRDFEILFSCQGDECGGRDGNGMEQLIYPTTRAIGRAGQHSATAFSYGVKDRRYLAARSKDGRMQVGLYLAEANHVFLPNNKNRVAIHIDILELEAMEERMIDASEMAQSISTTGRVKLDSIYFDFGAATLTAESSSALAEMARLLGNVPELDIYVVGHTDSVGSYEANLTLSRLRAEAVVAALVNHHGIAAGRVVPAGVGPLAPLASNLTEDGRASNRRVELVAR